MHSLHILNSTDPTDFTHLQQVGTKKSVIDLTLSTTDLTPQLHWSITSELYSGHRPIFLEIAQKFQPYIPDSKPPSWRLSNPDIKLFHSTCENSFAPLVDIFSTSTDISAMTSLLTSSLLKVGVKAIGHRSRNTRPRKAWFNPHVKSLYATYIRSRRLFHRKADFASERICKHNFLKFRHARDVAKKTADSALNKFSGKNSPVKFPPMLHGGQFVTSPVDQAEARISHFQSISITSPHFQNEFRDFISNKLTETKHDLDLSDDLAPYNCPITKHELESVLSKLKNSAVGLDSIPNWFYKSSSSSLKKCILELFNESFLQGSFPDQFKLANLVAIPKPRKKSSPPESYRPISLLNTLSRIFESIMQKRLYFYCETNSILPDSQSAYRKYNSCIDPLIRVTQDIHSGFNRRRTTVMVQLDFSKAFDTVWVDGLLYKLQQSGLQGKLPAWISSFLSNRKYRIVNPSPTTFREFPSGVPQGP
jgi:hypothetical protein